MKSYKKILLLIIAILLAVTLIFPRLTRSQFATVDQPSTLGNIWNKVETAYDKIQGIVGAELANRTFEMFFNSLAYDVATELAEGGAGGKPQFRTKTIGEYMGNAGGAAVGEFIGTLSEQAFEDLRVNLCSPNALSVKLTLSLSLIDEEAPPKPACDWRRIQRDWGDFADNLSADLIKFQLDPKRGATSTRAFFQSFTMEQSDYGAYAILFQKKEEKKEEAIDASKLSAEECQGYLDKATPITDEVITHCSVTQSMSTMQWFMSWSAQSQKQWEKKNAATSKKLGTILKDAAGKFYSTFTSKLMNNWIKKGMWSLYDLFDGNGGGKYRKGLIEALRGDSNIRQPRNADIFKEFKKIEIVKLDDYSFMDDFSICPPEKDLRKPDNCVIGTDFVQAINSKKTLNEAIAEGLIDPKTPLISPEDLNKNTSDNCYKDSLCYKDLIKLRKTNVIPIGWEIAAQRSSVASPVSLAEAIECFEDAPNSNCIHDTTAVYDINGVPHNPFYHLVDGDWVLKAPKSSCEALVYAPVLESSQSTNRQQYCADMTVCLREDENGNCLDGQYGYCTKSENIWRFRGDMCDDGDIYNGCLTFESNYVDDPGSFIESSLEYCSADQAGCKRYSQEVTNSGEWSLGVIYVDPNDLYLNRREESCNEEFAGCSEYIVLAPNRGVNLVANAGFNNMDGDSDVPFPDGRPDGWIDLATGEDSDGVEYDGDRIANGYPWGGSPHAGTESLYQTIPLVENTTYRISASAGRYNNAVASSGRISILLCDVTGNCANNSLAKPLADGGDCTIPNPGDNNPNLTIFPPASGEMERASCSFTTNSAEIGEAQLYVVSNGSNASWFDNIKVEVVGGPEMAASSYTEYGVGGVVYMSGSTFMCEREEVGCQGYTPVNGGPMVPGTISEGDLCPNECVGYSTFAQQPNIYDIMEDPASNPPVEYYNFIPDTANSCPDSEIGCEEFTNLDEVAQGGEGREYYSFLRQCVEQDLAATFFTWEGNDTTGYQIITRDLLGSEVVTFLPDGVAPCTNIAPGGNVCQDTIGVPAICGDETPADPTDDPDVDPNCREYFDTTGRSYFRFQDRVIYADNDCHDYKRTSTGQIYKAIPSRSIACSAENDGCRSYYGNAANNLREIFSDNFEVDMYYWEDAAGPALALSQESLNDGGQSLRTQTGGVIFKDLLAAGAQVYNEKEYELSFWMRANAPLSDMQASLLANDGANPLVIVPMVDPADANFRNIGGGTWNYYTTSVYVDTLNIDLNNLVDLQLRLSFNGGIVDDIFLDNVTMREVYTHLAVVKDSWDTPVSCDTPYEGYHLGCQSYIDTNGAPYNLKSFSHLCREEAIGCAPAIDTQNSTYPFSEEFNTGDLSRITVPADSLTFLVPNSENYCPENYKGCSALGLPDDSLNPSSFETVYKMNDPDAYGATLCEFEGLDCEEFNSAKGTYYFKIISEQGSCSYLQNVLINDGSNDQLINGWFNNFSIANDTNIGCSDDGDGTIEQSDYDFIWDHCTGHPDVHTEQECTVGGWFWENSQTAASCPPDRDMCTAFRDPQDPVGCDPNIQDRNIEGYCSDFAHTDESACRSNGETWTPACDEYYYYKNDKIDETSCNGQVDRNSGCILLADANNWNGEHSEVALYYDSNQSYDLNVSRNQPYSPTTCNPDIDPTCTLDANLLVRASKDRQCAEWLTCKSSTAVFNKQTNDYDLICDGLDSCVEFDDDDTSLTSCKKWADYNETNTEALTAEVYQTRTTGRYNHLDWSDFEYTGYAVPDMLPPSELVTYNFGDEDNPEPRLTYSVWDSVAINTRFYDACVIASDPAQPLNDAVCTAEISGENFYGDCEDGICWVNPMAQNTDIDQFQVETRGYATPSAPFPAAISPGLDKLQAYSNANECDADENGCEAAYVKVTYGDALGSATVFHYPKGYSPIPGSICTMGRTNAGIICTENSQCDSASGRFDGQCAQKTKEETFFNWQGVCMEKDKSETLVKDNEDSNSCNIWYPTDSIDGISSLFNNFREAGYHAEDGNDALFCAVAEPFEFTEDTYFCGHTQSTGGLTVCTVLIKVPAGAMVSLSGIQNYGDEIVNGYLRNYADHAFDEPIDYSSEYSGASFPNGFGVDWVEKNGVGPDVYYNPNQTTSCTHYNNYDSLPVSFGDGYDSFFRDMDFTDDDIPPMNDIPVIPFGNVAEVFNTGVTSNASGPIDIYYYDEEVSDNGNFSYTAGILVPGAERYHYGISTIYDGNVVADVGKSCEDKCRNDWGVFYCPDGWHESLLRRKYTGSKCKTWGPREHWSFRYCNPGDHNYYVKAEYPPTMAPPAQCSEYDCGAANKGLSCLHTPGSTYNDMLTAVIGSSYSWMLPVDIDPNPMVTTYRDRLPIPNMALAGLPQYCYNNPNCLYIYCVERASVSNDYCSEFGEIRENTNADGVVTSISIIECLDNLYETDPENGVQAFKVKDDTDNVDPNLGWPLAIDLGLLDQAYNTDFACYNVSNSTNPIYDGSINNELTCNNTLNRSWLNRGSVQPAFMGCLESDVGVDCSTNFAMAPANRCYWWRRGNWIAPYYCSSVYATTRDGADCTGLECFQQCRIVTELDSEGDRSYVRTDIWWRNEESTTRLVTDNWTSYYYHNNTIGYGVANGNVDWDNINDNAIPDEFGDPGSFDTFGAAKNSIGDQKLFARAPLDSTNNFSEYLTAHFFSFVSGTPEPVVDAYALAEDQMEYLFFRTFNFEWRWDLLTSQYTYIEPDTAYSVNLRTVEMPNGNNNNPFAGAEFDPVVYKSCENKLCPITDLAGEIQSYEHGITVNNSNVGRINGHESLFVSTKFFYYAHPDHMPIVDVGVVWGDQDVNLVSSNPGKYKNSLETCDPNWMASPPTGFVLGFGGTVGACQVGYKVFYNDYAYDADPHDPTVGHPCNGATYDIAAGPTPAISDASCFRPGIRVEDRWGRETTAYYDDWIVIHRN